MTKFRADQEIPPPVPAEALVTPEEVQARLSELRDPEFRRLLAEQGWEPDPEDTTKWRSR